MPAKNQNLRDYASLPRRRGQGPRATPSSRYLREHPIECSGPGIPFSLKAGLFVVLQEIDMRRREGSGLTVARLHRLAARCELPKLLVFAEGTAEARAH